MVEKPSPTFDFLRSIFDIAEREILIAKKSNEEVDVRNRQFCCILKSYFAKCVFDWRCEKALSRADRQLCNVRPNDISTPLTMS